MRVEDIENGQVASFGGGGGPTVTVDGSAITGPPAYPEMDADQLGAVARPSRVRFVGVLPKTRSGKLLRRAIQAVCEGRDPGDLTTMDDPAALQQIKDTQG